MKNNKIISMTEVKRKKQEQLEAKHQDPSAFLIPEESYAVSSMLMIPSYVLHQGAFWLNKDPRITEQKYFKELLTPLLLEWFQRKLECTTSVGTTKEMPSIYTLKNELVDSYFETKEKRQASLQKIKEDKHC